MDVGRMLFFDMLTGRIIVDTGEWSNVLIRKNVEQQIETYIELSERNRDTFDVIELPYGAYAQDFAECTGYRVNPVTKELEFSYPDPSNLEVEQPYQAPLSVEIESLKQENTVLKAQNNALSERADFIEDVVAEMAIQVYH